MPAGTVHRRDSAWAGVSIASAGLAHAATAYYYTDAVPFYTLATWGVIEGALFWGRYITPDWDQEAHVSWWVKPYAQLIPHRSFWSHGPVVSTLGRVAYSWLVLFLLGLSIVTAYSYFTTEYNVVQLALLYANLWRDYVPWQHVVTRILGLIISDFIHWLVDGMPTRAIT